MLGLDWKDFGRLEACVKNLLSCKDSLSPIKFKSFVVKSKKKSMGIFLSFQIRRNKHTGKIFTTDSKIFLGIHKNIFDFH